MSLILSQSVRLSLPTTVTPEKKQRVIELLRQEATNLMKTILGLKEGGIHQTLMKDVARLLFAMIGDKGINDVIAKHDTCKNVLECMLEMIEDESAEGLCNDGEYLDCMTFLKDFRVRVDKFRDIYIKFIWNRKI